MTSGDILVFKWMKALWKLACVGNLLPVFFVSFPLDRLVKQAIGEGQLLFPF